MSFQRRQVNLIRIFGIDLEYEAARILVIRRREKVVEFFNVTEEQIFQLFAQYGVTPHPTLVHYLRADYHLIDHVNNGHALYGLPPIPSDNPLGPTARLLQAWQPLFEAGYLPIAEMGDGWGTICLQLSNQRAVWFDHEQIAHLDRDQLTDQLTPLVHYLFCNLESFYEDVFTSQTSS